MSAPTFAELAELAEIVRPETPKCSECLGHGFLPIYDYSPWREERYEVCYQCSGMGVMSYVPTQSGEKAK